MDLFDIKLRLGVLRSDCLKDKSSVVQVKQSNQVKRTPQDYNNELII